MELAVQFRQPVEVTLSAAVLLLLNGLPQLLKLVVVDPLRHQVARGAADRGSDFDGGAKSGSDCLLIGEGGYRCVLDPYSGQVADGDL